MKPFYIVPAVMRDIQLEQDRERLKAEIRKFHSKGFSVIADLGHWGDIPDITKRTLSALKDFGYDGAIMGGFLGDDVIKAANSIKGFRMMFRSPKELLKQFETETANSNSKEETQTK